MNKFEFKKMLLECLAEDTEFSKVILEIIIEKISNIDLKIKKTDERAVIPTYGSERAAGFDLRCILNTKSIELKPGETMSLNTGISMEIPRGYVGILAARSGLGCKKGLIPSNAIGR